MVIDVQSGLCNGVEYCPSPNCDERETAVIDCLVLHSISLPPGEYHNALTAREHPVTQFFKNELLIDAHPFYQEIKGIAVSAHFLVRRNGQIIQYVPLHKRAWHAGESYALQGSGLNNNSIGIEIEGFDEGDDGFSDAQYAALLELIPQIQAYAPKIGGAIYAHSDIAIGRKTDPGPYFDWNRLSAVLTQC